VISRDIQAIKGSHNEQDDDEEVDKFKMVSHETTRSYSLAGTYICKMRISLVAPK